MRQAATRSPKAHATAPSPKSNACLGIRLPDERAVDPRHRPGADDFAGADGRPARHRAGDLKQTARNRFCKGLKPSAHRHPRPVGSKKDVDGRDKPGHDMIRPF
jgi:hypothetical protein